MTTEQCPHRRLNRLTGEWVLVSPQRMKRPWQGERKPAAQASRPEHDANCYLCPGNERMGGTTNPDYSGTHVFANDFPALLAEETGQRQDGLLRQEPARGEARVICYSPDHSSTLARMNDAQRLDVVQSWCAQSRELGQRWAHVEIFENKGAMMGASSPHPHGQVWAGDFVPTLVEREERCQRGHAEETGSPLLGDVLAAELEAGERVVAENRDWVVLVPYWAAWPFETLVLPREQITRLEDIPAPARSSLAAVLGKLLYAYDALFDTDFPYSMGWHGAPHALGEDTAHWWLHAHFYPPLLRSADIRKHMVGFELLGETQRDLTAEAAAARLKDVLP